MIRLSDGRNIDVVVLIRKPRSQILQTNTFEEQSIIKNPYFL